MAGEQNRTSLDDSVGQVLALWGSLTALQKGVIGAVGAIAFGLLIALVFWAQTPEYAVAFTDLGQEDAAVVVEKLKEMKIPYEIAGGGSILKVPSKDVYEVRLQLASQGLPQGGVVGFEVFDQASFGLTEFTQRVNYQRALEGELARTISKLDAVQQARVHLVIPEERLYLQEQKEPTASIVLRLRPGRQLASNQIAGIAHLVSSSVEGMKPANVTVLDATGNVLSSATDDSPAKASATQMEMKRNYEQDLQRNVQAMLEQAIGPSKAVVRVNALLNWDQYESNSESYSPGRQGTPAVTPVVRSSQQVTETYQGPAGTVPGGVPGASSNLPPVTAAATPVGASSGVAYQRTENTTNFEVSKNVEHLVKAPGSLQRLSVAVLLDGQPDEATLSNIEKVVQAAVGYDQDRGDTITISAMPFERPPTEDQDRELTEASQREFYISLAKVGAVVIIALLFFLFLRSVLIKPAFRVLSPSEALPAGAGASQIAALASAPTQAFETLPPLEGLPEMEAEALQERQPLPRRNPLEDQVFEMARSQPQVLAEIIRNWMQEDSQA